LRSEKERTGGTREWPGSFGDPQNTGSPKNGSPEKKKESRQACAPIPNRKTSNQKKQALKGHWEARGELLNPLIPPTPKRKRGVETKTDQGDPHELKQTKLAKATVGKIDSIEGGVTTGKKNGRGKGQDFTISSKSREWQRGVKKKVALIGR